MHWFFSAWCKGFNFKNFPFTGFLWSWLLVLIISSCGTLEVEKAHESFQAFELDSLNFYKSGEKLTYDLKYGWINGGVVTVEVDSQLYKVRNKATYKIKMRAKTQGTTHWFAKIDDLFVSYVDTQRLYPIRFYQNKRENKYTKVEVTEFDYASSSIFIQKPSSEDSGFHYIGKCEADKPKHDLISWFAQLRNIRFQNLKEGDSLAIGLFYEGKEYAIKLFYGGREEIKTLFGKVPCEKLMPSLPKGPIFNNPKGISIFLTADRMHVPVGMRCETKYGNMYGRLIGYSKRR